MEKSISKLLCIVSYARRSFGNHWFYISVLLIDCIMITVHVTWIKMFKPPSES